MITKGIPEPKGQNKAFLDRLIADPKLTAVSAYLATHETTNRNTAYVGSTNVLKKPSSQIYLKKHIDKAKAVAVNVMDNAMKHDSPTWQKLAADQAERIMDRELGKATQRTESKTENLNLNITANADLGDKFTEFLKQSTVQN